MYCMSGAAVWICSADKPKSMANWKSKYDLKHITLLSDPSFKASRCLFTTCFFVCGAILAGPLRLKI